MLILNLCVTIFSLAIFEASARVLELDDRFLEVESKGQWLVMFYAPWCGHCKHMEPTWVEVGAALYQAKSDVSVARLDATKYGSLASKYQVRGFPTIKFFKHGLQLEYNGPRSTESIISFVNKAKGPEITVLKDAGSLLRIRQDDDVFFLFVGDEKSDLFSMYLKAAKGLFTSINFYSAAKERLTEDVTIGSAPTVLVFKDDKYYEIPANMPSSEYLKMWVMAEQFPSYNHLTGSSYHALRATGRRFAVAVLKDKNDQFNETMKAVALKRKYPYVFCWVEGDTIVNSMTYSTVSVPNLLVYDGTSYEYFTLQDDVLEVEMTTEDVENFFEQIKDGKIPPKGGRGFLEQIKRIFGDILRFFLNLFQESPIIASLVIIVPTVVVSALCVCLCSISDVDEAGSDYEGSDLEDDGIDAQDDEDIDLDARDADRDEDVALPDEEPSEGLRHRVKDKVEE